MPIAAREKYSKERIEQISELLNHLSEMGSNVEYKVLVDGLEVVPRTNDANRFSKHEDFIKPETRTVEIFIYKGSSRNCDRYIYFFGDVPEPPKTEGLNGFDVKGQVEEAVQKEREKWERTELERLNKELQEEVEELEEENEQLEAKIAELEKSQSPLNGFLGDVGASFVESFIKRNPALLKSIPGGESLAGLMEGDTKKLPASNEPEPEVSFSSTSSKSDLSEQEKEALNFIKRLQGTFQREEFSRIMQILEACAEDRSRIQAIINLLNTPENEQAQV